MSLKVLILGVNGFIGSHLAERIINTTNWHIIGLDRHSHHITPWLTSPRFSFSQNDMLTSHHWIEQQIQHCDVVLPLVAIATPATYVSDPLKIFHLDFEANLAIVRLCVQHHTRIVFPSTSEVYGMCPDKEFDEYQSPLVTGPINKPRWIYANCKQLLDRIIYAHGEQNNLPFTLFRPFNWIGPRLDDITQTGKGSSRVITQFIGNLLRGEAISLVNAGKQHRCFTDIHDGIDALMTILANHNQCANGKIFNIGNPHNNISIRELAETLLWIAKENPKTRALAEQTILHNVAAQEYYGTGYQDVDSRVPSIQQAKQYLQWAPTRAIDESLRATLTYYVEHRVNSRGQS